MLESQAYDFKNKVVRSLRFWFIIIFTFLWLIIMTFVPEVDYAWTLYLKENQVEGFTNFFRRTMFEGLLPGASDPPILFGLFVIFSYFLINRSKPPLQQFLKKYYYTFYPLRPVFGYFFIVIFSAGLGIIHSLKWILGRPRPWTTWGRAFLPYSEWYEVGAHYIDQGIYRGSFPSGHTATAFLFIAVAYALLFDPAGKRKHRIIGFFAMIASIIYAGSMIVANSMGNSHWLSDGIGAIGLTLIIIHVLYFWILNVPKQRIYFINHSNHFLPAYFESIMVLEGFFLLLGIVLFFLGVRAFWSQTPLLLLLIPAGAAIFLFRIKKFISLYKKTQQI